jgi:hypothetical protein
MREWRLAPIVVILLQVSTHASAQENATSPSARSPSSPYEPIGNPAAPTFNNPTQILSSEGGNGLLPQDRAAERLSVQMTVSIPFDPSMSDPDRTAAMMQSVKTLREIISRQCELSMASFDAACRVGRVNVTGNLATQAGARQLVGGGAEFALTAPAAHRQEAPKP